MSRLLVFIGQDGFLSMSVLYNEPFLTTCHVPPPTGPPLDSCRDLRNRMPYGEDELTFGPKGSGADIIVPFNLYSSKCLNRDLGIQLNRSSGDGRCVLTIDSDYGFHEADELSWKTIYLATTEMEAKCVTQRKSATVTNLGEHRELVCINTEGRN